MWERKRIVAGATFKGTLIMLAMTNVILVGLIVLMFDLGGFFIVIGWVLVIGLWLWDCRESSLVVELMEADPKWKMDVIKNYRGGCLLWSFIIGAGLSLKWVIPWFGAVIEWFS